MKLIPDADLRVSSYPLRSPGGQHAGSPPMGVEVEHLPTGTVARVSANRSQHMNRKVALEMIETALTSPNFMDRY